MAPDRGRVQNPVMRQPNVRVEVSSTAKGAYAFDQTISPVGRQGRTAFLLQTL